MTLFGGNRSHLFMLRHLHVNKAIVVLECNGKSIGLPSNLISKETVSSMFNVQCLGLHLKIQTNGKDESIWPLSNGNFLIPAGIQTAKVIAFDGDDDEDQVTRYIQY